jgi:hypothetical protein
MLYFARKYLYLLSNIVGLQGNKSQKGQKGGRGLKGSQGEQGPEVSRQIRLLKKTSEKISFKH